MRIGAAVLGFLALVAPARAAGGAAELAGRATLGADERPVTLRLACDPEGYGLSATLTVPRFAELSPAFDFDALEGPTGSTKPLAAIRVSGAGGVRGVTAAASGAVAVDPATSFTLTVSGARRGEDPLRGLGPGLTEAGARITWTQSSPRRSDATLAAAFPVTDPAALRSALAPCLPR
ncbi:hypothetical protein Q8W71_24535 [Methylobacterium sp. NEAU 140]|uniref:hypothetical protein n=1 Tax=Methylobacterium sp. NEAU 140 TaxID=3064945 RepID=UPI0027354666|nr:hypothetical protein [Methylobacterium sp. NEAU 140]MDP4025802.1 hypothetical protein [Methylobacterium sp. NEAU 140]